MILVQFRVRVPDVERFKAAATLTIVFPTVITLWSAAIGVAIGVMMVRRSRT